MSQAGTGHSPAVGPQQVTWAMPEHVVLRQESPCLVGHCEDADVKVLVKQELFPWVGPSEPVLGQVLWRQSLWWPRGFAGEGPLRTLKGRDGPRMSGEPSVTTRSWQAEAASQTRGDRL